MQYFDYTLAPERYLKDLRRLAEEVVKKQYHSDSPAHKLAFTFTSLDLWLSSGGALPIEWRLPLPASVAPAAAAPAAAVAAAPAAAETEPPAEPSPSDEVVESNDSIKTGIKWFKPHSHNGEKPHIHSNLNNHDSNHDGIEITDFPGV